MADKSDIGWTDATWQIITGCSVDTPGCKLCYAMDLAGTRLKNHPSRVGLTKVVNGKHVWTGEVRFNRGWLFQPLQWRKPRLIFVAAHGDLFHPGVKEEWLDEIFATMALAHWHTFQILTKRSARMREYLSSPTTAGRWWSNIGEIGRKAGFTSEQIAVTWRLLAEPLPNVHVGVSAERQREADIRVPDMLATPAAKRFVSAEPLLGPIDFATPGWLRPELVKQPPHPTYIDQIITGGESGRGKRRPRPVHVDAFRSIRDQCERYPTAFFHKQNGSWLHETQGSTSGAQAAGVDVRVWPDGSASYLVGTKAAGNLLDGVVHEGRP
jgi:protein gp37